MSTPVLSVLQNVVEISSSRDRSRLPWALLRAVVALLGEDANVAIFSRGGPGDAHGEPVLRGFSGPKVLTSAASLWPALLAEVRPDGTLMTRSGRGRSASALILPASEIASEQTILVFDVRHADTSAAESGQESGQESAQLSDAILSLAQIYGNQIRLLDYSELDTLTRLLNRKSFEETFDRLLTVPGAEDLGETFAERRDHLANGTPAWLCVVDVDHFKRVNDSFGHLFGDQVLLRLGDLMRRTFRAGDRLFRFGGEEFVVILNAADEALAEISFERFRHSVEDHEFPQVGKVTCSIGFTNVSARDVPTDVVGRADEALYYAKEHGRNLVCCYERLAEQGAIARPPMALRDASKAFDSEQLLDVQPQPVAETRPDPDRRPEVP